MSIRGIPPGGRPRNPIWVMLWFVSLLAAEWVVLRFHYGDWRANSPRVTWALTYGSMLAIAVGFLRMTTLALTNPIYRAGRVLFIGTGGLVCLFNLLLVLLTCGDAWPELQNGVDYRREEVTRLRGDGSDVVVYYDAARAGVLVDPVIDVMVQRHAFPWQNKLMRMDGRYEEPTLEGGVSGARLVLTSRRAPQVVRVVDLDWKSTR